MAEDKFLAFKGLKQYDPDSGWASVDSSVPSIDGQGSAQKQQPRSADAAYDQRRDDFYIDPEFEQNLNDLSMSHEYSESAVKPAHPGPRNAYSNSQFDEHDHQRQRREGDSTGPHSKGSAQDELSLVDPLLSELFDQLNQPPQDELTQSWKIIATTVNILSQRMAQRKVLKEKLLKLDNELETLRSGILHDLEDIQKAADQQLSMARLRAEVSTLAQARLASRLRKNNG